MYVTVRDAVNVNYAQKFISYLTENTIRPITKVRATL
jgi:hypothetical protein